MSQRWSPRDHEVKRRILTKLLREKLEEFRQFHPQTGRPCSLQEAFWLLVPLKRDMVERMVGCGGETETVTQYRALADEVMVQIQREVHVRSAATTSDRSRRA